MVAPAISYIPVEHDLCIEQFDARKSVWMPYIEQGCFGTFNGLYCDVVLEKINLSRLLAPFSTVHSIKVGGSTLMDERIMSGDRIVLNESLKYDHGKKIAYWLPEFCGWTVKTLQIRKNGCYLVSADGTFDYRIQRHDKPLGMVTSILHNEYYRSNGIARSSFFPNGEKKQVDLAQLLNPRPSSGFCAKMAGNSLYDARITHGDRIIVDKSLEYINGKKIVYWLHEHQGWTVKILSIRHDGNYLVPANASDSTLFEYKIKEHDIPWGMVTWVINQP